MTNLKLIRYKVVADYPGNKYAIGRILTIHNDQRDFKFKKFPHLFRKLKWWEDRKLEDMPKYIKFVADYMDFKKGAVYEFDDWGNYFNRKSEEGFCIGFIANKKLKYGGRSAVPPTFDQLMPATEAEFKRFNSRNKKFI